MAPFLLKTPVLYAPWISFFLCAVLGILCNHWFAPGADCWKRLFFLAVFCLVLTKIAASFMKRSRINRKLNVYILQSLYRTEAWFAGVFLYGYIWIWLAATALAGLHHEYYYNYFPDDEIGLHVPDNGVASSLVLRVIRTPVLREYDEKRRSAFGADCSTSFIAQTLRAKNNGCWETFSGKVAVTVSGDATNLRIGDQILAVGKLNRPERLSNPNDRDRILYYRSQRILTLLHVDSIDDVETLQSTERTFTCRIMRRLERVRLRAAAIVRERLSERNAAVAVGMTLGFRNDVDDSTHEKFRRTGTIHLLAISGLHVMLVVGAIAFLLRLMGAPEKLVCIVTIIFVFFYMGMTDMRPPVVRASILVTILCVSYLFCLDEFSLDSLAIAALILLALNPCDLFQPGAQLSFLATGTFLWSESLTFFIKGNANIARYNAKKRRMRNKPPKSPKPSPFPNSVWFNMVLMPAYRRVVRYSRAKIRGVITTGAVIWAVGSPLILAVTNLFTPIAIVANPIIWLPATFALFLGFAVEFAGLCADCSLLSFLMKPVLWLVTFLAECAFDLFLGTLDFMEGLKLGVFHWPAPPVWTLWLFYAPLVFWSIFPHLRPLKRWVALFALLWVGVVYGAWAVEARVERSRETLAVDVFDVGHGCAVLGRFSDGRTFLYDCGSLENAQHAGEIVAQNLWNAGRTKIDLVVLSHADFDHYSGMTELLSLVKVENVCVSPAMFQKENESVAALHEALSDAKVEIGVISGGDSLDAWGFPELTALHPVRDENEEVDAESNSNSLVLAVDYLDRILVFPGDLDAPNAAFLETPPLKCDFVLAPHHGGHSAQVEDFYGWTDPDYVGISGGTFLRSYAAEDALRDDGRLVAHTHDDGDIQILIEKNPDEPDARGVFRISTYKTKRSSVEGTF